MEQSVLIEVKGLYQLFLYGLDVIDLFDGKCEGFAVVNGLHRLTVVTQFYVGEERGMGGYGRFYGLSQAVTIQTTV